MTDYDDSGPGDVRRPALAAADIDQAEVGGGSASTQTPTAGTGSCEHPGIVIRLGPTGPRAALSDGPDVWEVIAALHALRDEAPTRRGEALRAELRTVTGLTAAQVAAALDYYTTHPEDVDTRIAVNNDTAEQAQLPPTGGAPSTRNHPS